jgi:carbamate kinase
VICSIIRNFVAKKMKKTIVIALGGNALLRVGQKGSHSEVLQNVAETCEAISTFLSSDINLVIGHGNGPQVGNVLLQHSAGKKEYGVEVMPLDVCVAETQGSIAYMIEMGLQNIFAEKKIDRDVVSIITQVLVDTNDTAFANPKKPVGPYYTKEQTLELSKDGSVFAEDPKGNGWRKVVASPKPIDIKNIDIVKHLAENGSVVITVGGGGIPVVKQGDTYKGVEAVIDKDLASALAATKIGAEELYILTDVPKVYINFRKENEKALDVLTVEDANKYLAEGQFTEGSMAPKVRAALCFLAGGGKKCIITDATHLNDGTHIVNAK